MPFPLSMSPQVQSFAQQAPEQDADDIFKSSFSEYAFRALQKRNPGLLTSVITFRVLDTDVNPGYGLGAFILQQPKGIIYVPVVVSDNEVKPLDMFYDRASDRFFPLTPEWLKEVSREGTSALGAGVKQPTTLQSDVDIRNLVVPPMSGRFSYASYQEDEESLWRPFKLAAASENAPPQPLQLLSFLAQAPSAVKVAFTQTLARHPSLMRAVGEFYGASKVAEALRVYPVKTAAEQEFTHKGGVFVATKDTPVDEIRKWAGKESAKAYESVRTKGFYLKDNRTEHKKLFSLSEGTLELEEPSHPGLYRVYLANGKIATCVIIKNPEPLGSGCSCDWDGYERSLRKNVPRNTYLLLFPDGRMGHAHKLVATPLVHCAADEMEAFLSSRLHDKLTPGPGAFISFTGPRVRATVDALLRDVSTTDDFSAATDYGNKIILSRKAQGNRIVRSNNASGHLILGGDFKWFDATEKLRQEDFVTDAEHIFQLLEAGFLKTGSVKVAVAKSPSGILVGPKKEAFRPLQAVAKLAEIYGIAVNDAAEMVQIVGANIPVRAWALSKTAAEQLGDPNAGVSPVVDPAMQQSAQPTGLQLALAEKRQAIEQQMQGLQNTLAMIEELEGRSMTLDQSGGAMAAPGAAAAMMGGPMPQRAGGPMFAAPPPAQGQGPMPQGPMPQGQMQPGMPLPGPAYGGVAPAGGFEQPPPPPPPPVMTEEITPENVQAQINPQFLNNVAELQSADIFDASSIATLGARPEIWELVQAYIPGLYRALDSMARVLLLIYMKETKIKEGLGSQGHNDLEQKVRTTFKGLGDAILALNRVTDPSSGTMTPFSNKTVK